MSVRNSSLPNVLHHRLRCHVTAHVRLPQGALIATAWTALMHLGEQGYLDHTARIMQVQSCDVNHMSRHISTQTAS
jgi:hypothetical protein